jgi:putative molybdopterin biosynthesis protein
MDKIKKNPNNKPNINRLLKPEEVAEILNISRSFAYLLMQSGQIPTVRLGKARRVRLEDLNNYIEKNFHR